MKRMLPLPTLLLLVLLSSACASTEAAKRVAAFSDAVNVTLQNTSSAFDTVERKYADVLTARTVVNYDSGGFDPRVIHPFLSQDERDARTQVITGLKRYAESLAAILSDDQITEFDKQTKALGGALTTINADLVKSKLLSKSSPVSDGQIAIFTTAVNALGRWFIEYKRQTAVREAVAQMDQHVANICDMLTLDLGTSPADAGKQAIGLRAQLWNEYTDMLVLQDKFIRDNKAALDRDPALKRAEIKQLVATVTERQQADATLKAMKGGLQTLKATHAKLGEAFGKNTIELDHLIGDLITEGKRIKDFYDKLEK